MHTFSTSDNARDRANSSSSRDVPWMNHERDAYGLCILNAGQVERLEWAHKEPRVHRERRALSSMHFLSLSNLVIKQRFVFPRVSFEIYIETIENSHVYFSRKSRNATNVTASSRIIRLTHIPLRNLLYSPNTLLYQPPFCNYSLIFNYSTSIILLNVIPTTTSFNIDLYSSFFYFLDSLQRYGEKQRRADSQELSGIQLLSATAYQLKKPYQQLLIPITVWIGMEQAFIGADFTQVS